LICAVGGGADYMAGAKEEKIIILDERSIGGQRTIQLIGKNER
jgi:hypothetical protein